MKKDINNKAVTKYIDSPLLNLLRIKCIQTPWLPPTKAEMAATLIPRHITHIKVFGIRTDMYMDSQRQHVRPSQSRPPAAASRSGSSSLHGIRAFDTELHKAASSGSLAGAREAVQKNKDHLWHGNAQGNLPVHLAVEKGHKDVALYLVKEYRQGSYALNGAKRSPLYLGVEGCHKELVDSMLKALATDNATELLPKLMLGKPILHAAITSQNEEMVRIILKHQPELVKSKDEEGRTPLSYALQKGFVDIVKYLLKRFRNSATTQDNDGFYPVHKACLGGDVEILKIFHSYSPKSFLLSDKHGRTVLHLAAKEHGNKLKHVVSYLLSLNEISKELVSKKDGNRYTPLALAERSKNGEVIQLINRFIHP